MRYFQKDVWQKLLKKDKVPMALRSCYSLCTWKIHRIWRNVTIGNLRSYDGNCNENVTLKLNFAVSEVFCDYFMLVTLYKIGELHFRLLGTNGFQVKAKSERFTAASSRCRQNLKYENFTSSFGRLRQDIVPKNVPHVQHDYIFSFSQSNL